MTQLDLPLAAPHAELLVDGRQVHMRGPDAVMRGLVASVLAAFRSDAMREDLGRRWSVRRAP